MTLEKAIKHGKERRKPYRDSRRFDFTCRNHGAGNAHPCPWCERNRLFANRRRLAKTDETD